jgi:hypothetical protein
LADEFHRFDDSKSKIKLVVTSVCNKYKVSLMADVSRYDTEFLVLSFPGAIKLFIFQVKRPQKLIYYFSG